MGDRSEMIGFPYLKFLNGNRPTSGLYLMTLLAADLEIMALLHVKGQTLNQGARGDGDLGVIGIIRRLYWDNRK